VRSGRLLSQVVGRIARRIQLRRLPTWVLAAALALVVLGFIILLVVLATTQTGA
jgi:type VI protein secretion system component VasF